MTYKRPRKGPGGHMKPLSDETMALLRATLAEYGADYGSEGIRRLADGRQFAAYATTPKGRAASPSHKSIPVSCPASKG